MGSLLPWRNHHELEKPRFATAPGPAQFRPPKHNLEILVWPHSFLGACSALSPQFHEGGWYDPGSRTSTSFHSSRVFTNFTEPDSWWTRPPRQRPNLSRLLARIRSRTVHHNRLQRGSGRR